MEMQPYHRDVQAELFAAHLAQRSRNAGHDQHHDKSRYAAKHHDFKRVQFYADCAACDGHGCERNDCANHPKGGANGV